MILCILQHIVLGIWLIWLNLIILLLLQAASWNQGRNNVIYIILITLWIVEHYSLDATETC